MAAEDVTGTTFNYFYNMDSLLNSLIESSSMGHNFCSCMHSE